MFPGRHNLESLQQTTTFLAAILMKDWTALHTACLLRRKLESEAFTSYLAALWDKGAALLINRMHFPLREEAGHRCSCPDMASEISKSGQQKEKEIILEDSLSLANPSF